jgi:hypothetical protein
MTSEQETPRSFKPIVIASSILVAIDIHCPAVVRIKPPSARIDSYHPPDTSAIFGHVDRSVRLTVETGAGRSVVVNERQPFKSRIPGINRKYFKAPERLAAIRPTAAGKLNVVAMRGISSFSCSTSISFWAG